LVNCAAASSGVPDPRESTAPTTQSAQRMAGTGAPAPLRPFPIAPRHVRWSYLPRYLERSYMLNGSLFGWTARGKTSAESQRLWDEDVRRARVRVTA
jgi:hypothetical protein